MPIYNKEKYLIKGITSIQNKLLKNIEISAINDFFIDKSLTFLTFSKKDNKNHPYFSMNSSSKLSVLKEFAKYDKGIKIINNNKNYGLLYSREMKIINSNGEYIMNLGPDDELEEKDNLEFLYNKTKKKRVDVLSFASLFKINNESIINFAHYTIEAIVI